MAQVDQKRAKRARASGNAEEKALLQDLMAGKGVNKEILATVLRKLAAAPHVKVTTDARHRMLDAATDEFFESCSTSIELQLMCGTSFTWWLCDPNLLLGRVGKLYSHLAVDARQAVLQSDIGISARQ